MGAVRRARPWVASLLLHGAGLFLLGLVADRGDQAGEEAAIEIDLTAPESPAPDEIDSPEAIDPVEEEPARQAAAPARTRRQPAPASPTPAESDDDDTASETDTGAGLPAESGLDLGWRLGGIGDGDGDGGGGGGGGGGGRAGRGTGGGGGGKGAGRAARRASPAPAARSISRARPPRLVYPKRFRDERGGEVFVAILTIDEDGWVVGVRLKQGVNPFADQKAMDAVWRFHYLPALDRAGRPTSSRVEQRFMVE